MPIRKFHRMTMVMSMIAAATCSTVVLQNANRYHVLERTIWKRDTPSTPKMDPMMAVQAR